MYDVLGSFSGPDNPFFDEGDSDAIASLVSRVLSQADVACSDYKTAVGVAADFIEGSKKLFIDEILKKNDCTFEYPFSAHSFYDGWISSFFTRKRVKMNVLVNNIYIDEMRVTLNGTAAVKWGSEDETVLLSLKMPMGCKNPDNDAYRLYPNNLKEFGFGLRDIALLTLDDDGCLRVSYQ
ncbi:MAG: hypothetical protein U9O53_06855 [archaeon]|nr:hypothetical protein [archaeon]